MRNEGFHNGNGKLKAFMRAVADKPVRILGAVTPGSMNQMANNQLAREKVKADTEAQIKAIEASYQAEAVANAQSSGWSAGVAEAEAKAQIAAAESAAKAKLEQLSAVSQSTDAAATQSGGGLSTGAWIGISAAGVILVGTIIVLAVRK